MTNGLSKIKGHDLQKDILKRAVKLNRTAHSYLFKGMEGIGKKLLALEFARMLNCLKSEEPSDETETECGCMSCTKTIRGINPDVRLFEYQGANNIRIDDIRKDIENEVYLSPYESKYKVFIVDGAERMNLNAQNAFLKTLEEPPPQSVIILITSTEHQLLPTIISRCQIINFSPVSYEDIRAHLKDTTDMNESEIEIAARAASGSMGKAVKINVDYLNFRKQLIQSVISLKPADIGSISEIIDLVTGRFELDDTGSLKEFFELLGKWMRDVVLLKSGCDSSYLTFPDLEKYSADFARKWEIKELVDKMNSVERYWYEISRLNVNKKLTIENMIIGLVS